MTRSRLSKWAEEIRSIQVNLSINQKNNSYASICEIQKIIFLNNILFYTGLCFSFLEVTYVFPWAMMGLSISSHWTTVSHHISHGGYMNVPISKTENTQLINKINKSNYNRFTYGVKVRRFLDWMDYILPEAWHCEHNVYHHYKLNEDNDPDNVQHNLELLRNLKIPNVLKYLIIIGFAFTWRLLYYSPNSYKYYKANRIKHNMIGDDYKQLTLVGAILNEWPNWISRIEYFFLVLFPIIIYRTVAFSILYILHYYFSDIFTQTHLYNVIKNYILADIFCNVHTFIIIVPNHAGSDLYVYRTSVTAKSDEWLLRQCISSANYMTGYYVTDYLQGWLNYQIEHHLFPSLSMYEYRLIHREVQKICKKYDVPYTCENVFRRLWKTVEIMTGQKSIPYYEGSELEKYMNT
jgi:fatty acid desaturase